MTDTNKERAGRFTKKPVTIDAWLIDATNKPHPSWVHNAFAGGDIDWRPAGGGLYINTREGHMLGNHGDYLIRGIQSELYACKPDIFAATYESEARAAKAPAAPTQAEFALRALVAAGFVTQAKVNEAMTLPGAPPAATGYQQALDIRTAHGWKLGGDKTPVLYTDEINGQQVCRDDVWLCTTAAFAVPPAAEPVAYSLQWPDDVAHNRINISTTFDTEKEAQEWLDRCEAQKNIRVVPLTIAAPPAPTEQWVSVAERLPEWVHRDDTPCFINGKAVPPTLTSKTVLVALHGGGVRTDKLTTIEGKSNGWWRDSAENTWQEAVEEAKRGAMLIKQKGGAQA